MSTNLNYNLLISFDSTYFLLRILNHDKLMGGQLGSYVEQLWAAGGRR